MTRTVPHLTIALDLGDTYTQVCVLDRDGNVIETRLPTDPGEFEALFHLVAATNPRLVFEVGSQSRWVQKLARKCGIQDIIAADPRKLRLISQSSKKTDQRDALVLAQIGQAMPALLSPVEHLSEEIFADRALLESRDLLVRQRTQLVCRIRSLVKTSGKKLQRCSAESFARKAPEQIPSHLKPACRPLFVMLGGLDQQIRQIDKRITSLIKERYPIAAELQAIGGVGEIVAIAFALIVGDPWRIQKTREVGPYLGLAPRKQQSGSSNPQLGITKAGNRTMRRLLVLAAHCLLSRGKDCALQRWAKKLCERGGRNAKKRAVIALARKLAVVMLAIWKSGAKYDPWYGVPASERPAPLQAA